MRKTIARPRDERLDRGPAGSGPARGDDAQLVAAMVGGSRDALAALYDRHASQLLAVARRILGEKSEAEDVLHDVFLEAWRQARGYDPARGTVRAWLLVRLRARALDRLRLRKLYAPAAEEARAFPEAEVDGGCVRRALTRLPGEQRRAVELAYCQGLSASEIAALDRTPLGTVKSRITMAMAKLRAAFAEGAVAEGRA